MNIYREINREITLKNQELKTILATRTAEVNYLQGELLHCREENKALRTLIMDVVRKNSQEYNRLLEAITGEFGYNQQPQQHQQESLLKSQCNNRPSTRLSKSLNGSTKSNRTDPLMLALTQNRKSSSLLSPAASRSPSYNGNQSFDDDNDNNDSDNKKIDNSTEEMLLPPMITRRRLSKSKNINDHDHQTENVENIQPNVIQNLTPDPSDTEQRSYCPLSIINESNESLAQTQLSSKSFAGRKSTKLYESFKANQSGSTKKSLTPSSTSSSSLSSSPRNFVQMNRRQCIQRKTIEFASIARLSNSELNASSSNDDASSSNDDDSSWKPEKKPSIKKTFVTVKRGTKTTKEPSSSSSSSTIIENLKRKNYPKSLDSDSSSTSTPLIIQNVKRKRYAKLPVSDLSSQSSSPKTDNEKTPTKDELNAALVAHSTPIPSNNIASRTRRSLTAKFNNDNVTISEKPLSHRQSSGRCFTPRKMTIKEESPQLTKTGRLKRKAAPKCLKEPPTNSKLRRE